MTYILLIINALQFVVKQTHFYCIYFKKTRYFFPNIPTILFLGCKFCKIITSIINIVYGLVIIITATLFSIYFLPKNSLQFPIKQIIFTCFSCSMLQLPKPTQRWYNLDFLNFIREVLLIKNVTGVAILRFSENTFTSNLYIRFSLEFGMQWFN